MSTIFAKGTGDGSVPRPDATIRIHVYPTKESEDLSFVQVELLEFHPDREAERTLHSGYALVRLTPTSRALTEPWNSLHQIIGEGILVKPFVSIRAWNIHPADLRELLAWCKANAPRPLIVHRCPSPYPQFIAGQRVVVLPYKDEEEDRTADVGEQGTVTERSTPVGRTFVRLDNPERRLTYPARSFPSLALYPLNSSHSSKKNEKEEGTR